MKNWFLQISFINIKVKFIKYNFDPLIAFPAQKIFPEINV